MQTTKQKGCRINKITNHGYIRWLERVNPKARSREQAIEEANKLIEDVRLTERPEKKTDAYFTDDYMIVVDRDKLVTVMPR